jgi:hypothetical protein
MSLPNTKSHNCCTIWHPFCGERDVRGHLPALMDGTQKQSPALVETGVKGKRVDGN